MHELERATLLAPSLAAAQYDLAVTYTALEPPRLELAEHHLQAARRLGFTVPPAFLKRLQQLHAAPGGSPPEHAAP